MEIKWKFNKFFIIFFIYFSIPFVVSQNHWAFFKLNVGISATLDCQILFYFALFYHPVCSAHLISACRYIHFWINMLRNGLRIEFEMKFVICIKCVQHMMQGEFMMTSSSGNIFRATGPFCREFTGRRWIEQFPWQIKGQWRGALMFSLILVICAWINSWVNNCEAGDLRCHHAHYDVIVMYESVMKL